VWKKLLIGILMLTTIFINSPVSHGASNYAKGNMTAKVEDSSKYQIISPEKDIFASSDKTVLVSGKAPNGTSIIIEAFGTTDMTRNNFSLTNLPDDKDYVRRLSETIKVNGSGLFSKELDLILGVNKIVVTFKNASDEVVGQKIIYVSDLNQANKSVNNIPDSKISDIMAQK